MECYQRVQCWWSDTMRVRRLPHTDLGGRHHVVGVGRVKLLRHAQPQPRAGEDSAYGCLRGAHQALGDFSQAIAYYTQHLAIAKEVGDRAGEGSAGNNLGVALEENGDLLAAARALVQALAALQRVERLGRARRPPRVAV